MLTILLCVLLLFVAVYPDDGRGSVFLRVAAAIVAGVVLVLMIIG